MKGDTTNSVTTGKLTTPVHNVSSELRGQTCCSLSSSDVRLSWPVAVARLGVSHHVVLSDNVWSTGSKWRVNGEETETARKDVWSKEVNTDRRGKQ